MPYQDLSEDLDWTRHHLWLFVVINLIELTIIAYLLIHYCSFAF